MQPRGLTPKLNDQLNARLRSALSPIHDELVALGTDPALAQVEVTALFAHSVGLPLLNHIGRIRMFHQDATELFQKYLDGLLARMPEPRGEAISRDDAAIGAGCVDDMQSSHIPSLSPSKKALQRRVSYGPASKAVSYRGIAERT